MKLCVIGAGDMGAALAPRLAATGHRVRIARFGGGETPRGGIGRRAVAAVSVREGIHDADVVILSVPFASVPLLRWLLSGLPPAVPVVDTTNYLPERDGPIVAVERGEAESRWVSEQIGRPVIKAWNHVAATRLSARSAPRGRGGRLALSVAGDDPGAKEVVMALVEDTGFDAIDGGLLSESWRQQPGTPAYGAGLTAAELRNALAAADRFSLESVREARLKVASSGGDGAVPAGRVRRPRAAGRRAFRSGT